MTFLGSLSGLSITFTDSLVTLLDSQVREPNEITGGPNEVIRVSNLVKMRPT